jgi:hypothetical protein
MFEGRTYQQKGGYRDNAVRFADLESGVATTAYSYAMTPEERFAMARRITAALNLTTHLSVGQMEASAPIEPPAPPKSGKRANEPVPWENFPAYLINHCEGDTITEEGLQAALAAMLANPQYKRSPSPVLPGSSPRI